MMMKNRIGLVYWTLYCRALERELQGVTHSLRTIHHQHLYNILTIFIVTTFVLDTHSSRNGSYCTMILRYSGYLVHDYYVSQSLAIDDCGEVFNHNVLALDEIVIIMLSSTATAIIVGVSSP